MLWGHLHRRFDSRPGAGSQQRDAAPHFGGPPGPLQPQRNSAQSPGPGFNRPGGLYPGEAPRRGGVSGERAVPEFGPVPSAGQPPVWRPEPGPAGALRQAPGGQGVKRVVRLPLPHPNHRLRADERGGHRHRRGRHGPGHQRPAEPGADRNAAQQGEAWLFAVGAGPHQNRHGQAPYQGLAGAAPFEPGENHPAAKRRGGAVPEPPAAGPAHRAAHRHLRFRAHHDPHCLRLGQRPGAALSVHGSQAAAGAPHAAGGLPGHAAPAAAPGDGRPGGRGPAH